MKEFKNSGGVPFSLNLAAAYRSVINNDDLTTSNKIFSPRIEKRGFISPIDWYFLSNPQINSLLSAMKTIGEDEINITCIPTSHSSLIDQYNWKIPIGNILDYPNTNAPYSFNPNSLFSTHGTWGLIISDSEFGLIGGSQVFVDSFFR